MNIQKITLLNTSDKNIYYSYTNSEGLEILQKELEPNIQQTIWAIPNSLKIPQYSTTNLEITEEYVTLENSCDSTYCSQNCCQYRITARAGSVYTYINCEGVEITGILDTGQSVLICTSNFETIVAKSSIVELLGCCTEFPPQTPSNTPTPTVTPTPGQNIPTYYYDGSCGEIIPQDVVGGFENESFSIISYDLGTYVGYITLSFSAGNTPDKFDITWNNNTVSSGFRSTCYDFTPQTCSVYNQTLLSLGYAEVSGSGSGTININKSSSNPQTLVVRVTSPIYPAEWDLTLNCVTSTPTPTITQTSTQTPTPTITPTTVLRSILMFTSTTLDNVCIAGSGSTSSYYTNSSIIQVGSVICTNPELTEFAPEGVYGIAEDEVEGIRIVGNDGGVDEVKKCQIVSCCPVPKAGHGSGIIGQKNINDVIV